MEAQASRYARSLIEASLDPLITISAEGKIMDMNQATANITGLTREQITDSDFFDYFTEPQKAREVYKEVFAKGSVADSPLTLRHKNGKLTDVLFNGSVFKDDDGLVLGVVIVARDVAEQKWAIELRNVNQQLEFRNNEKEKRAEELSIANIELEFQNDEKEKRAQELIIANKELEFQNNEKEKRADELSVANIELAYQNNEKEKQKTEKKELEELSYSLKLASQYSLSLLEASRDPLITISPKGKITDMNQATANIIGLSREQITDSDFFDYFTEPQKAREVYQEVFAKGSVADSPLTLRHKNGKLTDVLFNGSVYRDDKGNVLGVVIVARDVTDQKRITMELNEAKNVAEEANAVAQKANEAAQEAKKNALIATQKAEDAVKAKQQFLSNMSHEIRTPMNAIIGFTKVLLKSEHTAKQKEYLSAIKMSGDALIVLINDILDLAKVDAGKMSFEQIPFRLELSIYALLHLFETKIQEKNIKLVIEYDNSIPKVLLGDPVRLHQIILNLVSNALKFTNKGYITVTVKLVTEDDESAKIYFAVSDTGIGIEQTKLVKIFDNFQQATSGTSRLYGGTGLGLAIVKQLVEPQGGKVSVESVPNIGSKFSFVLSFPKTKIDVENEIELPELDASIKNIRVLVAEDIPLNQLLMKTILDDFGFEREIAENGKITVEKTEKSHFDVILMDLQMPEMNGFEATAYIRNVLKSDIPIIALTADVTTTDLAKCKAVGMNDYISKPVDERVLYTKIINIVNQTRTDKEDVEIAVEYVIKSKCTNLDYLNLRTKSNPKLMMEMISLYLEQTPPLINAMKQSLKDRHWGLLYASVHKIIPSFAIMGMNHDFENIAKKVQEFAGSQQQTDGIQEMVLKLETVCLQACDELKEDYLIMKNAEM
jgi:PAS domain S-box-containing protein